VLIARAASTTRITIEASACPIIKSFVRSESGSVSVALKAELVVEATKR